MLAVRLRYLVVSPVFVLLHEASVDDLFLSVRCVSLSARVDHDTLLQT